MPLEDYTPLWVEVERHACSRCSSLQSLFPRKPGGERPVNAGSEPFGWFLTRTYPTYGRTWPQSSESTPTYCVAASMRKVPSQLVIESRSSRGPRQGKRERYVCRCKLRCPILSSERSRYVCWSWLNLPCCDQARDVGGISTPA